MTYESRLDVIVALTSTTIRLDIVSELTNKKIEFRQSRCFQKVWFILNICFKTTLFPFESLILRK